MQTLIVTTDTIANARFLATFLKTVSSVKSVSIQPRKKVSEKVDLQIVKEPSEPYNWTNPTRPATDEEFEQMIAEAESSPVMTLEEAKAHTYKMIDKWSKEKK